MGRVRRLAVGVVALAAACGLPATTSRITDEVVCGDGAVGPGEVCDDGNTSDGDGCSADCKSDESCGNGILDAAAGELCDDGNTVGGDNCSADCKSDESCGNGIVDRASGETCDDGNLVSGDGCSANCQSNETCGNSVVDVNEECDSGNKFTAQCDPDCTFAVCGDGVRNAPAGEACDDANNVDTDACVKCKVARCGDGFVRAGVEQCDDGNTSNADACLNSCQRARCGDGFVRAGVEQCDDGNGSNDDACLNSCVVARCGDGYVHAGVEQCDDGNTNGGDGCDANCQLEPAVYVISDINALVNVPNECSGDGTNPYNPCDGSPYGFTWNDMTSFDPSSITIEIDHGIDCAFAPHTDGTQLNGADSTPVDMDNQNGCTCLPPEQIVSWTITDLSAYQRGAPNTITITGPSCQGFSDDLGLGGWVRITVYP